MQRLRVALLLFVVLVLQTSLAGHLRVAGVAPDLMLLLAAMAGMSGGPTRGAVFGFVGGMAIDLFLETPLGLSALVFSVVGYWVGTLQTAVLRQSWWIPVAIAVVASAAGEVLWALAGTVVGQTHLVTNHLLVVALVVAVGNGVLALFVLRLVNWATAPARATRGYAL